MKNFSAAKRFLQVATLGVALMLFAPLHASATVIGFEDLTTRNNFTALGIADNYQGFEWGYGHSAGVSGRTFVNNTTGWASATVTNTALGAAPSGTSGSSYAWNWNGPQSLWIDFRGLTDVTSVNVATLSSGYSLNASSIQLFGYDASSTLIDSSDLLNLSDAFQTLTANFSSVTFLEIRANANSQWFSIDDLVINENSVPEPGSLALMGLGLLGFAANRRKAKSN